MTQNSAVPSKTTTDPTPAHTPGPWKALTLDNGSTDHAIYIVPEINDLHPLATVWLNPAEYPVIQNGANANLISAAPDLLAALLNVRAALNCHYDWTIIQSEYGAQINAAIAKAGGKPFGPISVEEELARL